MKIVLNVLGVLLGLTGLVWIFQGIGVIQGSFMTGQSMWSAIGLAAVIVAGVLLYYANRKRAQS